MGADDEPGETADIDSGLTDPVVSGDDHDSDQEDDREPERRNAFFRRNRTYGRAGTVTVFIAAGLLIVAGVFVVANPRGAGTALLAGTTGSSGTALAAERIDTGFAGSIPIDDVTVSIAQRPSTDPAVSAVLTDLNTYWDATLPADFGVAMTPLRGGYQSVDPSATAFTKTASALCISSPQQISGNAYYCPGADGLMFDSGGLIPVLLGHYGVGGLISSFGHEFGHAIQARVGPSPAGRAADPDRYPSLILENAADCYSGAFLSWVTAGDASHLHLPRSALVRAIAPLLDFRDPVDLPADDPTAHGLALDRLRAFLKGLDSGPEACRGMVAGWVKPTLGWPGVSRTDEVPRFASQALTLAAARASLGKFVAAQLPAAAKSPEALTRSVPIAADLQQARPFGQFAEAATEAMSIGRLVTGSEVGAACFTGAWTAYVFGKVPAGALGSRAGDADEALDFLRSRPEATIDQLAGYADGFTSGWHVCR